MALIHGAQVLRPRTFAAEALHVIVEGDTIRDVVAAGSVGGKGLFDRYTLELYLTAVPRSTGRRTLEDQQLCATLGASASAMPARSILTSGASACAPCAA